jgi:hypothetical protein
VVVELMYSANAAGNASEPSEVVCENFTECGVDSLEGGWNPTECASTEPEADEEPGTPETEDSGLRVQRFGARWVRRLADAIGIAAPTSQARLRSSLASSSRFYDLPIEASMSYFFMSFRKYFLSMSDSRAACEMLPSCRLSSEIM